MTKDVNILKRIREIVDRWKDDTWTDGLSYDSMSEISDLLEKSEIEPCEDCISRKDTIDWLKRVTVTDGITFETGFKQILHDIEQMPSVRPEPKTDGDCIRKRDAIDLLSDIQDTVYGQTVIKGIEKLPGVQPKAGHWKRISIDKYTASAKYRYKCDKCGEQNLGNTNFCPNCGCRMSEVSE